MLWIKQIAQAIDASDLTTQQLRRLAFKALVHAYYVNRPYWTDRTFFGEQIAAEPLTAMKQIVAAFETALEDKNETLDRETLRDLIAKANPDPDALPGILPGWVALLDATVEALGESWESFYWSMANAYSSVANRSFCEARGIEGNCGFRAGENAAEAGDELCGREIQFQLEQLSELAG